MRMKAKKDKKQRDSTEKQKKIFPDSLRTFFQSLFISLGLFNRNSLATYAAACAFGFFFSMLPVLLMILIVLIRFLHTEQTIISQLYQYVAVLIDESQFNNLVQSALEVRNVGIFEIITALSILWLARRFFFSATQSFRRIFHNKTQNRGFMFNLWAILGEVIFVIGIAILIALLYTIRSLINTSFLETNFPWMQSKVVPILIALLPSIAMFLSVSITYRVVPGTKPPKHICFLAALCTTLIFWGIQKCFGLFLNITRYNLVYGVLSNIIVLLLEVSIFFQVYLFFAQYIYVSQFFDTLLLAELYLLPERKDTAIFAGLRRILFIRPEKFLKQGSNIRNYSQGDTIYSIGDIEKSVFYIIEGSVEVSRENHVEYEYKGDFFGETSILMNKPRDSTAIANTDVQLLVVEQEKFEELLTSNTVVAQKVLSRISTSLAHFFD